jgi:type I restriction enzyme S subunit
MRMSKKVENTLEPKLRFPEFLKKASWKERKLSEVLVEHGEKSTGNEEVYSVSVHKGVINQIEHLGRSYSAANTDNYKRVFPGDIIYTKSPTGDFPYGIIKQSRVSKPVIVSPLYGVFKPETTALGVILDAYFEYPSRVINYLNSIIQKGAKNTINITNDTFLSNSLILPTDWNEQQKIADCLSSLDELITAESQKLEALQQHKKGLMQELFPAPDEKVPTMRFKEFRNSGEWVESILGGKDVSNFVNEKTLSESLNLETYVSTENILADFAGITQASKLPQQTNVTKFIKGDILISNIRPYLKKVWASDRNGGASNDVIVVRPGKKINSAFLSCLLKSDDFINYVMKGAQGVKMPRGDKSLMQEYPVLFPDKLEQEKIAYCLFSVDELISEQSQKIESLKVHKKGLMQQLFPNTSEVS